MAKINMRLLPIKAHYLFYMAAMGPILPQISVFGKKMGISPDIMGFISSMLCIMYLLAKPLFGFIADYFSKFRKLIFVLLIVVMTLAYCGFYFLPAAKRHPINLDDTWNVTIDAKILQNCPAELLALNALCSTTRIARCSSDISSNSTSFIAHITTGNLTNLNLTANIDVESKSGFMCLPTTSTLNESDSTAFNGHCHFAMELQPDCLYGTWVFWFFILLLIVGTVGFSVLNSISDAICLDVLGESQQGKYGTQRLWCAIGYGSSALLAGYVVDIWSTDDVKSFTPAILIMVIFICFDLLSVSRLKLPEFASSESIYKDVVGLIRHPAIVVFLIFAVIAGILDSFIINFMFWHVEEVAAETGYMSQIKLIEGCVVAAQSIVGAVPVFYYSGKIFEKLGYIHTMSLCFFFNSIRLALIGWIPNPWYLLAVEFFFEGCTYALCYTCIVTYASVVAPPGTSATVQGFMTGMNNGLGFSIGNLIGGVALKKFGGRNSFYYFSILSICTCIAHILIRPFSRKKQYLPKAGDKGPIQQVTMPTNGKSCENGKVC